MKPLRVTYAAGMVNVDSDDISFGWIPHMYQGDRSGIGLQVNTHLDRKATERMCVKIAEAVAEFHTQNEVPCRCKRVLRVGDSCLLCGKIKRMK